MEEPTGDDDFGAKSVAFIDWLQRNGITISPKIELADLRPRAGRGVRAREDIGEDEEFFTIPRSSILTAESSHLPKHIVERFDDQWLSLITAMIFEYQRGAESAWKAYFDVLPEKFNTLMFWSMSELEKLEGSAVVNKIGKNTADEAFKTKVIPVLRESADVFRLQDTSDDQVLALCHRMGSTLMAYAFDLEKPGSDGSNDGEDDWEEDQEETEISSKGMVPLADMLNADADRNNAKLYYEDDKVVMKSIKPISAGEEIFNDYGPLPNADLLRRYGYITRNYEKYDVVEVSLDLIKQAALEQQNYQTKHLIERTAYLDEQGVLEEGYDISHPSNPENPQFPDEFCILLNTLTLRKPEFDNLKKKDKLPKPTFSSESAQLLYRILVKRRADYKPWIGGYSSYDEETASNRHMQADLVIGEEKKILHEAADAVQGILGDGGSNGKRKEPMDTFEEEAKRVRIAQSKPMTTDDALLGTRNSQAGRRTDLERQGKRTKYTPKYAGA